MASYEWVVKTRRYDDEITSCRCKRIVTDKHPLMKLQSEVTLKSALVPTLKPVLSAFSDPLSAALEGFDPLSQFVAKEESGIDDRQETATYTEISEEWLKQRTDILSRFTTSEKLSITSSFLQGGEKLVVKQQINDKMKHRLQQLDEFEENVSEHRGLSREDYVTRITQISEELNQAWVLDQRVKALKIVIQCSKLLLETHPFTFYPSKFVLITDILDNFGRLVFERIAERGEIRLLNHQLPDNFKTEHVSETARETCRNWMYKIASVRELLPRIYIEMAVLKCCFFIDMNDFSSTLIRLSRAIRGIGDPLIAAYARCYLMRVGGEKFIRDRSFVLENVKDFLFSYHQLYSLNLSLELTVHRIDFPQYLSLYAPALDWIFQILVECHDHDNLDVIWNQCYSLDSPGLLWQSILAKFPPDFIYPRSLELALFITTSQSYGVSPHQLMTLMGQMLSKSSLTNNDRPHKLIQVVWSYLDKIEDAVHYLCYAEAWMPYFIRHWRSKEIQRIINSIVDHVGPKVQSQHVPYLNNIIQALIHADYVDYHYLFTTDSLSLMLDLYPDGHSKAEASKTIVQEFLLNSDYSLTNAVMVDNLLLLARVFHDTLNAMSVDDEKRQIAELAIGLIDRVDFGRDFQQMLSFYGDARAAFTNLDPVLAHLVHAINRLSIRTRHMIQQHNSRTSHFVRACGAFAYITIPAIACPLLRFDLYLVSGQIALTNECYGQADACLEGAINLINELPPAEESWMISSFSNLLSNLLVYPDTSGQNRLHHTRRLLRNVRNYASTHNLPKLRVSIFMQALRLLSSYAQPCYIYHVTNAESNDQLYIGDEEFQENIKDSCTSLLTELLNDIQQLGVNKFYRQQASSCLDLFSVLITTADMNDARLFQLAIHLFHLAQKQTGQHDPDYAKRLLTLIHGRAQSDNEATWIQLASKLKLSL